MGSEIDIDEFVKMMSYENCNFETILNEIPSIEECTVILGMALAVDCKDWIDSEKTVDDCCQSIRDIATLAHENESRWFDKEHLELTSTEFDSDKWNELFMNAQSLFKSVLDAHLRTYGSDSYEKITTAYSETTFCLIYLAAAACVRSDDFDASLKLVTETVPRTLKFINEHCKMVERPKE